MTFPNILLWAVLPYLALISLIAGTAWRHKYDKFGWTTRSSELYERRLLRYASPIFHYGFLGVIAGHLLGLLVPESWTRWCGLTEFGYHVLAIALGVPAGLAALGGLALLLYRRRTTGPVFLATTRNDKAMYVVLAGSLALGLSATLWNWAVGGYDYRVVVSPWFRSLFYLQPKLGLMGSAPAIYRWHVGIGLLLIGVFPYTRLVHAFAVPVQYLFRPYLVYRSRRPLGEEERPPRRGWEPVGPAR
ncbi:respiratory nitrate reductase subunit gamma [Phaeacidiphilus oryzae]|uniref:respiratory nitrate reductase subunit gamma n=1 Tax=Phaeacidiphilus oryzae TaxID=348818 RepID=UPI000559E3F6|nr:respiratory nitrate reductase subunit gamma [Phaeacidiphilus oryzae]